MNLLSLFVRRSLSRRLKEIDSWMADPFPVQERTLLDLLRTAANTRFGREHGFGEIRSVADFQRRVPPGEYLDFKDLWEGLLRGETDVSWPGKIPYFPITSGTTAGNKYIPLSSQGVESNLKAGKDTFYFYLQQTGDLGVFGGKFLYLGGSTDLRAGEAGTKIGDLSAILNLHIPWYARPFRTPTDEISFMSNWEQKLDRIIDLTLRQNLRGATGIPSWLTILFNKVCDRVERQRGKRPSNILEVWPHFRLLIHGGISFDPYRAMFGELLGQSVKTLEVYPASEGFIAMQNDLASRDMLLMLDYGIFYEFIPADRLGETDAPRLTVADVKTGVNYAVVLTTNSGLWGYVLGDTVRFTSLRPHKLLVTGRTKHFLSAFGEHLIAEEVEEAVTEASRKLNLEVTDFHVAPLLPSETDTRFKPRHQWILEVVRLPDNLNLERLAAELDAVVQEKNEDYSAHRQGGTGLDLPLVTLVPQGTFYGAMKKLGKLGGQHKAPRLQNNRAFADELLAAVEHKGGSVH